MTFNTMSLSAYRDSSILSLNGWMANGKLSPIAMSPFMGIMGICLVSLLILGVLWLKSRTLDSGLWTLDTIALDTRRNSRNSPQRMTT